jgi:hypothetical protein
MACRSLASNPAPPADMRAALIVERAAPVQGSDILSSRRNLR